MIFRNHVMLFQHHRAQEIILLKRSVFHTNDSSKLYEIRVFLIHFSKRTMQLGFTWAASVGQQVLYKLRDASAQLPAAFSQTIKAFFNT